MTDVLLPQDDAAALLSGEPIADSVPAARRSRQTFILCAWLAKPR